MSHQVLQFYDAQLQVLHKRQAAATPGANTRLRQLEADLLGQREDDLGQLERSRERQLALASDGSGSGAKLASASAAGVGAGAGAGAGAGTSPSASASGSKPRATTNLWHKV